MWFTGWQIVSIWDLLRHGGKNRMTFHASMQGVRAMAGMIYKRLAFTTPAVLAASAVTNQIIWDKIGDVKTGSTHWAQAGNIGSGGSMPVIPELPTWRSVQNWWESL